MLRVMAGRLAHPGRPVRFNPKWRRPMDEREEIIGAAENNILSALRLLIHACGPDRARDVAHQLVDDHLSFEVGRHEMPRLPGLH
jgi:hypothetical protein